MRHITEIECDSRCQGCSADRGSYALGSLQLDLGRREARVETEKLKLTPQQFRLMTWLIRHPNVIHPFAVILEGVFGPDTEKDAWDILRLRRLICRIRAMITRLATGPGVPDIQSAYGLGYGLVLA